MAANNGALRYFRWPYQAMVMNMFEQISSRTVFIALKSYHARKRQSRVQGQPQRPRVCVRENFAVGSENLAAIQADLPRRLRSESWRARLSVAEIQDDSRPDAGGPHGRARGFSRA